MKRIKRKETVSDKTTSFGSDVPIVFNDSYTDKPGVESVKVAPVLVSVDWKPRVIKSKGIQGLKPGGMDLQIPLAFKFSPKKDPFKNPSFFIFIFIKTQSRKRNQKHKYF